VVENRDFFMPNLYTLDTPIIGDPVGILHSISYRKTRTVALTEGEKV